MRKYASENDGRLILRFFSLGFLLRSLVLIVRYPSLLIALARGGDVGIEVQRRKKEVWVRQREYYRNNTKPVFGLQLYLNPDDFSPVSSSIATAGRLDLSLNELILKVLKAGMRVVDVGANIGYYTLLFSKVVGSKGMVYAFEPEPFNFQLLNKSIRTNCLTNIRTFNQALSEVTGVLPLHLSDPHMPQAHSLSHDWGRGTIEVSSTTLDAFWESVGRPQIDLVKIHVGNDDLSVLRGAHKLISEKIRPIITMMFLKNKWDENADLVKDILDEYVLYRVVHSPFLIRQVHDVSLMGGKPDQVFLVPRSDPRFA